MPVGIGRYLPQVEVLDCSGRISPHIHSPGRRLVRIDFANGQSAKVDRPAATSSGGFPSGTRCRPRQEPTDGAASTACREPVQPQPARTGPAPQGHDVALEAVTFGYDPAQPVLHDVSFTVPQGTMTAIVGPSGAGKSTILHLLARFADVQAGRVTIGGIDVRDLAAEQLFDAVTVVFQDVYLFPGTIFDNIAFGNPTAAADQVEAAARAARAHDFIARLPAGYNTPVGEAGATLSGGERQRLSIARAILKDAPVVLLDEATAAIDPTNERHVQDALGALVRDKTLLVVAHRLATIASADQIIVLDEGRLVERGRHDDLLAGGRYARLWQERQRATNWRLDRQH